MLLATARVKGTPAPQRHFGKQAVRLDLLQDWAVTICKSMLLFLALVAAWIGLLALRGWPSRRSC
jgi:hypothetical protein